MSRRSDAQNALQDRIGYRFADPKLLVEALTHVSALSARRSRGVSYQRLEFLGDHVLGLAVSEMLFRAFPKAPEGDLSRRLSSLVRMDTCADIAREMELGPAIAVGNSEAGSFEERAPRILADACEALIGAIFLDGGYVAAKDFVGRYWGERLHRAEQPQRDAKTELQEWAQGRGLATPAYREIERTGPHHDPMFRVLVELPQLEPAQGSGRSKRLAEQSAAEAMLLREGVRRGRSG